MYKIVGHWKIIGKKIFYLILLYVYSLFAMVTEAHAADVYFIYSKKTVNTNVVTLYVLSFPLALPIRPQFTR